MFSDAKALAASLPEHLRNPNGCTSWATVDEHQLAIADYLRTTGFSRELAPAVSTATGVAACIFIHNRLSRSPAVEKPAPPDDVAALKGTPPHPSRRTTWRTHRQLTADIRTVDVSSEGQITSYG
jgi:hypothetical protein